MARNRNGIRSTEAHSRDTVVLVLGLLALIFCLLGVVGSAVFVPRVVEWFQVNGSWRPVTVRIVSGELQYSRTRSGTGVTRPRFRFVVEGEERVRDGYDLMGVYSSGEWARGVLDRFPPQAQVPAYAHPTDPERIVLERGPLSAVVLGLIPPLFFLIGLSFGSASTLRYLYLRRGRPRDGIFRWVSAAGDALLRESVLKVLFYTGICVTIAAILWVGIVESNWLLMGVAGFFVYGVWRASRRPKR